MADEELVEETEETEDETTDEETGEEEEATSEGLSMYIGPTIVGTIQRSTIYRGNPAYAIANDPALKIALSKYEGIADLVVDVDGDGLIESQKAVRTKGTDLYRAYKALRKAAS